MQSFQFDQIEPSWNVRSSWTTPHTQWCRWATVALGRSSRWSWKYKETFTLYPFDTCYVDLWCITVVCIFCTLEKEVNAVMKVWWLGSYMETRTVLVFQTESVSKGKDVWWKTFMPLHCGTSLVSAATQALSCVAHKVHAHYYWCDKGCTHSSTGS